MSGHDTPAAAAEPVAHPLARHLLERIAPGGAERILLLGIGSGRNIPALLAARLRIDAVEEDAELARSAERRYADEPRVRVRRAGYAQQHPGGDDYAAALSTHALLHGTQAQIGAAVAAVRARLAAGAPFLTTLGSTADPRYGRGRRIAGNTFAAVDGSEADVPHTYFDERAVRELFADFSIEELVEENAASSVGRWAHTADEAATIVHWIVRAARNQ